MKTACVFIIVALILSATCDPTKAVSIRAKRQWSWDEEGTPRPGPRPTPGPGPRPTPRPQTSSTSAASNTTPSPDQLRNCVKTCPTTSQYNPVCGSNGVTYDNEGKLNCARSCGIRGLEISFRGTCAAL